MEGETLARRAQLWGLLRRRLRLPRVVFLLIGSAMALAFTAVDLLIGAMIFWSELNLVRATLYNLLIVVVPTMVAMIPAVRQVAGAAAIALLDVDLGGQPTPARTWPQLVRTVGWFWLHLLTGAATGGAVVWGIGLGALLIVEPLAYPPGREVAGYHWLVTGQAWQNLGLIMLGLMLIIAAVVVIILCSALVTAMAPRLLGPTPQERIAVLDAQTTRLLERTRLARELHDSVGHALNLIVLQIAVGRRRVIRDPDGTETALAAAENAAQVALRELDGVLGILRQEDGATSRQPIHDLIALPELTRAARATGRQIDLEVTGHDHDLAGLPPPISREAYRIVQESLTNALRHAPGQPVTVRIHCHQQSLTLKISNPLARASGNGWTQPSKINTRHGHGLTGLAERVRLLGGESTVGPAQLGAKDSAGDRRPAGWQVAVTLPIPNPEHAGT